MRYITYSLIPRLLSKKVIHQQ
ncbi:hypothetical protein C4Z57_03940 [Clostridioides difficile]|uniref:Uncharacterized protein n=4 Tax=Bacillota TaxID=1239 RepID=A0A5N0YLA3_9ENTE|nr:putative conjugative transposon protein [Bhargavaea cecembensis]EGO8395109.1 hypothetical protein [Enterococcus faecalis]EGT4059963.1 hypothetical protein [Clostridioides difficile]KAA9176908.1 hypothetical protein F6X86_13085 [Enterococcus durans]MBO6331627.1 hypothetical protein [Enterococcus gallinarum]MST61623.1 hypothetical protein [Peptostreptococcus porci]NAZ67583.1 hypothetical protein [Streptococcus pyogenes]PQF96525.1 hypothetical protein CUS60_11950 [Enterococcus faecium]CAJ67